MVRPLLAVSIGCPAGIGPEIALAAAQNAPARLLLVGDVGVLRTRADIAGGVRIREVASPGDARDVAADEVAVLQVGPPLARISAGSPTREGGAAQLAWINAACDLVSSGRCDALITGPVSKAAIASSGAPDSASFLGHTEHLGARLGNVDTVMCFWAEKLTISLATTHVPLGEVARVLRAEDVERAAYWTARFLDDLGAAGDVAVLSLNPHAGESGLLGDEETRVLIPGIERARARSKRAIVGPLPAESAIRRAVHERAYGACVAMYHDQATIPSKLVAFGDAVNITLGLPIIRTSVDHGTAYDLAGMGRADANGMRAAIALATRLVNCR